MQSAARRGPGRAGWCALNGAELSATVPRCRAPRTRRHLRVHLSAQLQLPFPAKLPASAARFPSISILCVALLCPARRAVWYCKQAPPSWAGAQYQEVLFGGSRSVGMSSCTTARASAAGQPVASAPAVLHGVESSGVRAESAGCAAATAAATLTCGWFACPTHAMAGSAPHGAAPWRRPATDPPRPSSPGDGAHAAGSWCWKQTAFKRAGASLSQVGSPAASQPPQPPQPQQPGPGGPVRGPRRRRQPLAPLPPLRRRRHSRSSLAPLSQGSRAALSCSFQAAPLPPGCPLSGPPSLGP